MNKAKTLKYLSTRVVTARVLPLIEISHTQFLNDDISEVSNLNTSTFIVRSNADDEDEKTQSNAGTYKSILNVPEVDLRQAIAEVFGSYKTITDRSTVLIQPMLKGVTNAGVIFTHDTNSGLPYRRINFVHDSATDLITSGKVSGELYTIFEGHIAEYQGHHLNKLLDMLNELLSIFDDKPLDIEFAFSENETEECLFLLQCRPLAAAHKVENKELAKQKLVGTKFKIEQILAPHPYLLGDKTILSVMSDWNPIEMLGSKPKPLAVSLYKELITDNIWAYQRHNYGYRNLRSFPLLIELCGTPYIDTRVSFNSLIPADLPDQIADKLVNYYLDKLEKKPHLHDKIELDIALSCYHFSTDIELKKLMTAGFSEFETEAIGLSLKKITNELISNVNSPWMNDVQKVEELKSRRVKIMSSSISKFEQLYWLIEETKRYGTLPFAGLARAGFIAIQLLRSLKEMNIISDKQQIEFMKSVRTVASEINTDFTTLSKEDFLTKYGHLRPGTYDIECARYDIAPDDYFNWSAEVTSGQTEKNIFTLSIDQLNNLNCLLEEREVEVDALGLLNFIRKAIEHREASKFEFTKNISLILELIADIGSEHNLGRDDMSFIRIETLLACEQEGKKMKDVLLSSIQNERAEYEINKNIIFPELVLSTDDFFSFKALEAKPNFITQRDVLADVTGNLIPGNLDGKVILIESADPGYDWIFSERIAGLVTCWGGANSHMAIRAAELDIPAVIGLGPELFARACQSEKVLINCLASRIEFLP